jgi:hypothetical protein
MYQLLEDGARTEPNRGPVYSHKTMENTGDSQEST